MNRDDRKYSVGEVAKATGLTVRTLQHYDNIGLLPTSGRTEGGRRYYTQSELLKLAQIVFYKSVGIPLSDIRDKLPDITSPDELERIFVDQMTVLIHKINALHMAMSVLNASLDIVRSGNEPPWEMLAELIRAMEGSGLNDWAEFSFDPVLYTHLEASGMTTLSAAMEFYHTLREMMVEAAALQKVGADPGNPAGQTLAKRWWDGIVTGVANGNDEIAKALSAVNETREKWPEADRKLFERAEPFIKAALEIYIRQNNIKIPDGMLGKEQTND